MKKIIFLIIIIFIVTISINADEKYKLVSLFKYENYNSREYSIAAAQLIPLKNSFLIIYPCYGGAIHETQRLMERYKTDPGNKHFFASSKYIKSEPLNIALIDKLPYSLNLNTLKQYCFDEFGNFYFAGFITNKDSDNNDIINENNLRYGNYGEKDLGIYKINYDDRNGVIINKFKFYDEKGIEFSEDLRTKGNWSKIIMYRSINNIAVNKNFLVLETKSFITLKKSIIVFTRKENNCYFYGEYEIKINKKINKIKLIKNNAFLLYDDNNLYSMKLSTINDIPEIKFLKNEILDIENYKNNLYYINKNILYMLDIETNKIFTKKNFIKNKITRLAINNSKIIIGEDNSDSFFEFDGNNFIKKELIGNKSKYKFLFIDSYKKINNNIISYKNHDWEGYFSVYKKID